MRKPKRQLYLTSEELSKHLELSQRLGYPTEEVCECFLKISTHLLGDSRYRNYPTDLKEDMKQDALLKCIRNIKNYKPSFKDKCFNYFTRATEQSFWTTLSRHYKQMNIQRQLTRDFAEKIEHISPQLAKQLKDNLLPEDTTNTINEGKTK